MYQKKLMINGLQKQRTMLKELIGHLEQTPRFDADSGLFYDRLTQEVVRNLRKLKRVEKGLSGALAAGRTESKR